MSRVKGRLPPFVPVLKDTMKTAAWKALSHGARSLYVTLKGPYNNKLQNAVYVSTRDAAEELGQHSTRRNVMRWFRELQHYGFIVMVSPAHHGVNGHGKAPHYRLTEAWYLGKAPTRDFLSWDGIPFTEKRKRDAPSFTAKNRIRGDNGVTTLVQTGVPLVPEIVPAAPVAIPLKGLKLKRLYLAPAKRPDKRAEAAYLAAWYQIEQQGLRRPRNPKA